MQDDILPIEERRRSLFGATDPNPDPAVEAIDQVNRRFGKKAITLGSEGVKKLREMCCQYRSPRYTTRLSDFPVVR